ncbi:MAG: hypothetical protein A3B47_02775 [Candidatus Levybacteria bacterium RIFCSPLOWO2_01_FULL_39_24]|nr:MAG: hypothetical protein A2800_02065 [Candidatus Levybacteria bacterium RIFCSPHIGHO2_01_FULL_40_16]OGH28816.1 MAG: hypothetical protein A3E12_03950 [Candidatus Levybacteria bacterium RIFCSPHIGHO2_12_FULL_39_9]OGH46545.1 MAG: hypothetical protein A3B47_02775 [Candidatus Levybacteria bacterium RIFCSPLOWO2_01_FULL_39_24]
MEKHWSRGFTQHHLRELKELKKQMEVFISGAGFTLIELLIVIAVVGVLGTGVLVAIDPAGKINSAKLANMETYAASINNNLAIDLVGEWTFDGNANDTSGYRNNGTVIGATLTADRRGRANKAYSFDGSDAYINFSATGVVKTQTGWFYWDQSASDKGNHNHLFNNFYQHYANNFLYFGSTNDYINWNPSINTWYFLVLTYTDNADTNTAKLYVNGVRYSVTQQAGSHIIAGVSSISSGGTSSFKGIIDDVRIYKQALTFSQIQQLYAQGLVKHLLAFK